MFIASLIIVLSQGNFPVISILIGTTWAVYGLLRKQIKVSPATGLLYESGVRELIYLHIQLKMVMRFHLKMEVKKLTSFRKQLFLKKEKYLSTLKLI